VIAILRLASRLRAHLASFLVVVGASTGVLVAGVIVASASSGAVSSLIGDRPFTGWAVALLIGVVASAGLTWVEQWVAHVLAYRVIDALRLDAHRAIARLAPLGLARRTTGETVARAIGDAEALEWFYAHTAAQVLAGMIASVGFSAVAVAWVGPLGLLVPLGHLLLLVVPLSTMRLARRQGDAARSEIAELGAVTLSARRFARETLLLGGLDALARDVAARTARIQRVRRGIAARLGLEQAATEIVGAALLLAALGLAVAGVSGGRLDAALTPVVVVFAASSTSAALVASTAIGRLGEVRAAAARVDELLDAPGTRPGDDATPVRAGSDTGGIHVSGLHVVYPGDDRSVLAGIDLAVAPGEILAIAGPSGAGKTTLLLALARLIPTTAGSIEIGASPTGKAVPVARVALVGQHAHIFRTTVRDNLLAPDADDVAVWAALDAVQLSDRVRSDPEELDVALQEAGGGWSGGERQRLGLARGLLRGAAVLLLDEPTAGLDAATEAAFLATLRDVAVDRTVVIVTHREPVMRASDRVALLVEGRILDDGPHDELRARSAAYRGLLDASAAGDDRTGV
jgi:ABC-type transport system involved in cytochrome bd biosynthesis fused ATPase/permease subunit